MKIREFLSLADEFSRLGDAVCEQLLDVVGGDRLDNQNEAALVMLQDDFLVTLSHCTDQEIARDARGLIAQIERHLDVPVDEGT